MSEISGLVTVYDVEDKSLQYYFKDVHRALVEVGLIWRDGDRWCFDHTKVDLAEWPALACCDFCVARPATWLVTADEFKIENIILTGDWMACETCGQLIHARDRAGLRRRSLQRMQLRIPPDGWYTGACFVIETQEGFWRGFKEIQRYQPPYRTGVAS